jgi:hypothetical protein
MAHLLCLTAVDVIYNVKAPPANLSFESIVLVAISLNVFDGPATSKAIALLPAWSDVYRVLYLGLSKRTAMGPRT